LLLLQVDSKMVVVCCGSVLLAVDQHAADERVQLEALQEQLAVQLQQQREQAQRTHPDVVQQQQQQQRQQQAGVTQKQDQDILLQRQRLVPGLTLQLTMAESRALAQHKQQVEAWGWQVLLQESAAAAGVAGGVNAPALLQQVPVIAGVQLGTFDLQVRRFYACRR
jgi:DNA mismatch repair ATPase MutL